jgi:hypothetical protein
LGSKEITGRLQKFVMRSFIICTLPCVIILNRMQRMRLMRCVARSEKWEVVILIGELEGRDQAADLSFDGRKIFKQILRTGKSSDSIGSGGRLL